MEILFCLFWLDLGIFYVEMKNCFVKKLFIKLKKEVIDISIFLIVM